MVARAYIKEVILIVGRVRVVVVAALLVGVESRLGIDARLLAEREEFFSLKLLYSGDDLLEAVLDGQPLAL